MSIATKLINNQPSRLKTVSKHIETMLLTIIVSCYFLGDVITTIIGQELGAYESTASIRLMMDQFGYLGLVAHKLVIVATVLAGWAVYRRLLVRHNVMPSPFTSLFLVFFAYRGLSVTLWNVYFIFSIATRAGMPTTPGWL